MALIKKQKLFPETWQQMEHFSLHNTLLLSDISEKDWAPIG